MDFLSSQNVRKKIMITKLKGMKGSGGGRLWTDPQHASSSN